MEDLRFVPYDSSYFSGLRELYRRVWSRPRSVEYDLKCWNDSIRGLCPGVVALHEERIIGGYIVWPVPLTDGQDQVRGGQPIDTMVDPDFRGKGVLRELACRCYEICAADDIPVMFGAPNRAAHHASIRSLNWCDVAAIQEYLRPIPPWSVREDRWIEDGGDWVFDRRPAFRVSPGIPQRLGIPENGPPSLQRRWQVERTAQWMSYRYRSVPDVEYFTTRPINSPGAAAVCGFRNSSLGVKATLAELFAADERERASVLNAAISWARHKGARFMIARSTRKAGEDRLLRHGFVPVRRTPLISRTLTPRCFSANPFSPDAWALFGGAFDTI